MAFRHLLTGFDTIECAYYLTNKSGSAFDFARLEVEKTLLKQSKSRHPHALHLGNEEFLLANHGTGSGFPFLLENDSFSIQCGEFNKPNFFVTFRSHALWHQSAMGLHERFLRWAESVGLEPYKNESLSRVDFTFDYWIEPLISTKTISSPQPSRTTNTAKTVRYKPLPSAPVRLCFGCTTSPTKSGKRAARHGSILCGVVRRKTFGVSNGKFAKRCCGCEEFELSTIFRMDRGMCCGHWLNRLPLCECKRRTATVPAGLCIRFGLTSPSGLPP